MTPPRQSTTISSDVENESQNESEAEGFKLRRLLKGAKIEQVALANACGVSQTSTTRWMREETFSAYVWPRLQKGLHKLGLDSHAIRPQQEEESSTDLTPFLSTFSRDQMEALRRILESSQRSRADLLQYIRGALHFK